MNGKINNVMIILLTKCLKTMHLLDSTNQENDKIFLFYLFIFSFEKKL